MNASTCLATLLLLVPMTLPIHAVARASSAPSKAKADKKAPRIAVEPPFFDFGRLGPQRTVQKEFTIRNFGRKDLVIEGVSTTCGCTVVKMAEKVVKPGRSTPMKVNLETRTYDGRVARSVLVRSNDPTQPVLEVKLQATVVPEAK